MKKIVESNLFLETIYLWLESIYLTFCKAIDADADANANADAMRCRYVDREIGYRLPCGIPFSMSGGIFEKQILSFPRKMKDLNFMQKLTSN